MTTRKSIVNPNPNPNQTNFMLQNPSPNLEGNSPSAYT